MENEVKELLEERYDNLLVYTKLLEEEVILSAGYIEPEKRLNELKNQADKIYNNNLLKKIEKQKEIDALSRNIK